MTWFVSAWDIIKAGWFYVICAGIGTFVAHWLWYLSLDVGSRRRFKQQDTLVEVADMRVKELKALLYDQSIELTRTRRELDELRPLVLEERNHNRAWALRAKDVIQRHEGATAK